MSSGVFLSLKTNKKGLECFQRLWSWGNPGQAEDVRSPWTPSPLTSPWSPSIKWFDSHSTLAPTKKVCNGVCSPCRWIDETCPPLKASIRGPSYSPLCPGSGSCLNYPTQFQRFIHPKQKSDHTTSHWWLGVGQKNELKFQSTIHKAPLEPPVHTCQPWILQQPTVFLPHNCAIPSCLWCAFSLTTVPSFISLFRRTLLLRSSLNATSSAKPQCTSQVRFASGFPEHLAYTGNIKACNMAHFYG